MKTFYRRNLPHWQPENQTFFVTFRLWNSLPAIVMERLEKERERLKQESDDPAESPQEKSLRIARIIFESMDIALAKEAEKNKNQSPLWLANPGIAELVQEAIIFRDEKEYDLHRYVIMPNHVHILITPLPKVGTERRSVPTVSEGDSDDTTKIIPVGTERRSVPTLTRLMQGIKSWTALNANRKLGRTGRFWQEECFDHWVRDQKSFLRIIRYIDANPVKAGLCKQPSQWRWSSAGDESLRKSRIVKIN